MYSYDRCLRKPRPGVTWSGICLHCTLPAVQRDDYYMMWFLW